MWRDKHIFVHIPCSIFRGSGYLASKITFAIVMMFIKPRASACVNEVFSPSMRINLKRLNKCVDKYSAGKEPCKFWVFFFVMICKVVSVSETYVLSSVLRHYGVPWEARALAYWAIVRSLSEPTQRRPSFVSIFRFEKRPLTIVSYFLFPLVITHYVSRKRWTWR